MFPTRGAASDITGATIVDYKIAELGDRLKVRYLPPPNRWRLSANNTMSTAPPLCHCQEPMKLVRRLELLPEIFVFYCERCKQAETKVQEPAA